MKSKLLISRNIEMFYNNASEETRLNKGLGVFEFERIKFLIQNYLPSHGCKIIDVGGGTGKYSEWLAKKGHTVFLIEPILKHIHLAVGRAKKLKNKFVIQQGEARNLNIPDNFADIVILHGPLYHLQKNEDRELAICEAKRVLVNNGIILGFAINFTASTLVGLLSGLIHKPTFYEMCKQELLTGIHNPPEDFPWLLAEAFYHHPQKLKDEFEKQGLQCLNICAVEGMAWLDKDFFSNFQNEKRKNTLMDLIAITQNESYLLPFSPHIMIAAKKSHEH